MIYICPFCRRHFATLNTLTRHVRRHDEKTLSTCPVCHKQFMSQRQLVNHCAAVAAKKNDIEHAVIWYLLRSGRRGKRSSFISEVKREIYKRLTLT